MDPIPCSWCGNPVDPKGPVAVLKPTQPRTPIFVMHHGECRDWIHMLAETRGPHLMAELLNHRAMMTK